MTGCQFHFALLIVEFIESLWPPCYLDLMRKIEVRIEAVAFRGYGLGRINGKVVFIPLAVTGDRAWIEIIEEKKNYSMGRLVQLVEASQWRVNPPCPYFGTCGGCQWQHIDYPFQGELKKKILKESLERIGKLKTLPRVEITSSPESYDYRVRVQLKMRGKKLGYFQERSHEIVDIDRCPISDPLINQAIQTLRHELTEALKLKTVEINVSRDEKKAVLILHAISGIQGTEEFSRNLLQNHPFLKGIALVAGNELRQWGDSSLHFTVSFYRSGERKQFELRATALSFFQVNPEQNRKLIETVLEFTGARNNERVLDLYSGIGNFTIPLAAEASKAAGVEENSLAIEDARFNAEKNGIENCKFISGKAEEVLENLEEKPDHIIVDPPRAGCQTILDQVVGLNPRQIIYVSCEPTTFSRDIRLFSERGYALQRLRLIDMFPQSYHMEVVGLLRQC